MKKIGIIISVIAVLVILLAGMFSAGLIIGNIVLPKRSEITQFLQGNPIIQEEVVAPTDHPLDPDSTDENHAENDIGTDILDLFKEDEPISKDEDPDVEPTLVPQQELSPTLEIPPPATNLEELFIPFWETWDIVKEYYVDQPVNEEAMMQGAIQGMIDAVEFPTSTLTADIPGIDAYIDQGATPEGLENLFKPFWTNWALFHWIDDQQLVQAAITGMLNSLGDPHTSYMNPQDYEIATTKFEGEEEYEGIGAWVDISKDYLTIISPFPDSPAEEAGLYPGDKILAVNGEDMTGVDGELVRQQVLGPAGTTITLTIQRDGLDPFDVDVTRRKVLVPSVEARMLDGNVAYLRLFLFGDKSDDEVRDALKDLLKNDPVGLIFDLRGNGGGSVDTAVSIASEFIDDGVIFSEIFGDGNRDTFESRGRGLATDIPLVVLVNGGSASASEIVAGAIQDYKRAPLVGTTTFGKGSVQYWIPLSNNQGAVRVTIANWVTPNERQIHLNGLDPDIPIIGISQFMIDEGFDVDSLEMDSEDIIILSDEEVQEGVDIQLEKAKEILLNQNN